MRTIINFIKGAVRHIVRRALEISRDLFIGFGLLKVTGILI